MSTLSNRRGENSVQQKKGEHCPPLSSQHAYCSIRFKDMKLLFYRSKKLNISNFYITKNIVYFQCNINVSWCFISILATPNVLITYLCYLIYGNATSAAERREWDGM